MVILGTAPDARVGSEFEGLAQLVMQFFFSTLNKLSLYQHLVPPHTFIPWKIQIGCPLKILHAFLLKFK